MFFKLSTLALLLPFVSALTMNPPSSPPSPGGQVTLTWTASTNDPAVFSIQLVNPIFHSTFAIANSVPTSQGSITFTLPQLPVDSNYQLQAIAIDNVNDILSQTGTFAIVAASSGTSTGTSTSTGTGTASSATGTATGTASKASGTSASGTGTSSATPTTFSSGAASFKLVGFAPAAALVLSAVAGAAMVF